MSEGRRDVDKYYLLIRSLTLSDHPKNKDVKTSIKDITK
jgi:hypothetical protein